MKNLFAVIFALCTMLSVALPTHAGPGRPSFSTRPSYSGGFRSSSSPSYRSFSSSPSRTFTFRPSTLSYSRPAAAPRAYSYSAPVAAPRTTYRSSTTKTKIVNNHYHGGGSGGGGLSLMDYAMLHSLTSHDHGPTYVNAQPTVIAQPAAAGAPTMIVDRSEYDTPAMIYQAEESHFWRNTFLVILGIAVFLCLVAGFVHWLEADTD